MTPDQTERAARALWNIRREEVDQCDLELEDLRKNHPIWRAALNPNPRADERDGDV